MYISFGKNKRMIHIFLFFRKKECLKEIILTTPKFSNANWLIQFGKLRGFCQDEQVYTNKVDYKNNFKFIFHLNVFVLIHLFSFI